MTSSDPSKALQSDCDSYSAYRELPVSVTVYNRLVRLIIKIDSTLYYQILSIDPDLAINITFDDLSVR